MTRTPQNIPLETLQGSQEAPEAMRELMRTGSARIAFLTSMSLGAMLVPAQATAEDIRLAVDTSSGAVSSVFDGMPTTAEEMGEAAERQRIISQVSRIRQNGIEYYGPYLEVFHALDEEAQYQVALAIYPENAHGGPDLSDEYIELVRNLRVPEEMIEAILAEATENGLNRIQVRGYRAGLEQLRNEGNIGADTVGYIIEKAPNTTSQLYIVVVSLVAQGGLEEDRRGLEEDRRGLEEDRRGLEEDRRGLEEAQQRLLEAQRAAQAGREAVEALTD